jgi:hypothetical protein
MRIGLYKCYVVRDHKLIEIEKHELFINEIFCYTATTPSTTAVSARVVNTYTDLQLMPGQSILVSSSINASTQSITVWASGGDF